MSEENKSPAQGAGEGDNHTDPNKAQPSDADKKGEGKPADAPTGDEMVSVKKSDLDAMKGRQSALDIRENRLKKLEKKFGFSGGFKKTPAPAAPADGGDDGSAEDDKAKSLLIGIALDPEYREVLDANPMLRDMLTKNPLSILPLYAADAIDAEDAEGLVKEHLAGLKSKLKPVEKPADPAPKKDETPKAGGENSVFGKEVGKVEADDKEYAEKLKKGDTRSIADGIKHRLTKSFKKN